MLDLGLSREPTIRINVKAPFLPTCGRMCESLLPDMAEDANGSNEDNGDSSDGMSSYGTML